MTEDESRTDADTGADTADEDPIFKELTRLREQGLNRKTESGDGFPLLKEIAEAIHPEGEDEKPLHYAVRKAADRRGGNDGEVMKALFGIEDTFNGSYLHRRNKAREALAKNNPAIDPIKDDTFKRRRMKGITEDLAVQLRALSPDEQTGQASPDRRQRDWLRPAPWLTAALMALVVAGVVAWQLLASGSDSGAMFPKGAAVNVRTGALERRTNIRPPREVKLWEDGLFRGCNFSVDSHCSVTNAAPIPAQIGDTLKLVITLQSEAPEPVPYAKLSFGGVRPLTLPKSETEASMELVWPTHSQQESREKKLVGTLRVQLPKATGPGALRIVPGSAVIRNPRQAVVAQLPDSLNSPQGVALSNIGIPKSCFFNCRSNYIRYVEVKAEVVKSAYEFE